MINYHAIDTFGSEKYKKQTDLLKQKPGVARKQYIKRIILVVPSALVFFALFLWSTISVFTFLALLAVMVGLTLFWLKQASRRGAALQQFYRDNGWAETKAEIPDIQSLGPSNKLLAPLDTRTKAISGNFSGLPFYWYTYESKTKLLQYEQRAEVLSFKLPTELPVLILDATSTNFIGANLVQSPKWQGMQQVSLEGNFDKYFRLFVQQNGQIDALSLITPEIMQRMIDYGILFDIEFNSKFVHIINAYNNRQKSDLALTRQLLDFSELFAQNLAYKSSIVSGAVS